MRGRLPLVAALAAASLAAAPARARAGAPDRPADHQVKVALLFNFVKFVEWPDAGPIEICVVGEGPLLEAAAPLQGRVVEGRPLRVRRASAGDLRGCRVGFVAASESSRLEVLVSLLAREGALVVGDGPEFAARGAHLNFYLEGDHVRFEANVGAIRRDRVRVSSRLLRLARLVGDA